MTDRPAQQKSVDAYRTIGEVAAELNLPQHVLRFWETRFPQVKPLKRAGGRRFYKPDDVALLRAVQALLYGEGYTIKGVQRLLAEHGARPVADALARSRGVPVAKTVEDVERSHVAAGLERDPPVRHVPAPTRSIPSRHGPPEPAPPLLPPEIRDGTLADRLAAVLADLDDSRRLLSSLRSPSPRRA